MNIKDISELFINTVTFRSFHIQKEEHSNQSGYATYFEYSFSKLLLTYWDMNASCNVSYLHINPCSRYHCVFKYHAWKSFDLSLYTLRSGMTMDLKKKAIQS